MANNFKNFANGIGLVPNAGHVVTVPGDVSYNSNAPTPGLEVFTDTVETIATNINDLVLTNKRLDDGGTNSIGANDILGSTGTTNVVFSTSPTLTGTINLSGQTLVSSSFSNDYLFKVLNSNTTPGTSFGALIQAGTTGGDAAFRIINAANSGTFFEVLGNGSVGIGTAAPSHILHVSSNPSNSYLCEFVNTNTTAGTSFGVQIQAGTNGSDAALDIRNAAGSAIFSVLGQGDVSVTGNITSANLSGTNSGDVTLNTVGSSPSASGATLSGQSLTLQPADATHPGLVTSGTQTIGGNKTFSGVTSFNQVTYTTATVNAGGGNADGIDVTGRTYFGISNLTQLRGFTNGLTGQLVIVNNISGLPFDVKNNLSSFQKILCPGGSDITMSLNGSISFVYDGSNWKVVSIAN
jgi:hypothetical protein